VAKDEFLKTWERELPSAAACFENDLMDRYTGWTADGWLPVYLSDYAIWSQADLAWLATAGIVLAMVGGVVAAMVLARLLHRRFARDCAEFNAAVELLLRDAAECVRHPRLLI
jgi:hypothetical protein